MKKGFQIIIISVQILQQARQGGADRGLQIFQNCWRRGGDYEEVNRQE